MYYLILYGRTGREREIKEFVHGHPLAMDEIGIYTKLCASRTWALSTMRYRLACSSWLLALVTKCFIEIEILSLAPLCLTKVTCHVPHRAEASITLKLLWTISLPCLCTCAPPSPAGSTRHSDRSSSSISSRKTGYQYVISVSICAALQ